MASSKWCSGTFGTRAHMVLLCLALQSAGGADWRTFHGDVTLDGFTTDRFVEKPVRLWRTKVGTGLSSPVVGGNGRLFLIADDTTITALDTNGVKLWSRTMQTAAATNGVPARNKKFSAPPLYAHRDLLVVVSEDGDVYGLAPQDGEQRWTFAVGGLVQGTPSVVAAEKGRPAMVVVMEQASGVLYAMAATDGSKKWQSPPMQRTDGHISVSGGSILLGNCAAAFSAISATTGKADRTVHVGEGCEMTGGLAASGDMVFAGNRSGSFACADMAEKKILWINEDSEGELFTTPAVTEQRVVFCGGDGVVYAVDRATGGKIWTHDSKGMELVSPVIAGDGVVVAVDGTMFALAMADGALRWKLDIGDEIESPSIVDGVLVVVSDDGYVAGYGYPSSENKANQDALNGGTK